MTENELQLEVQALCAELGLLWHHCKDSRKCAGHPGFPDLVILGPGGLHIVELKSDHGDTSAEQDQWIWLLHQSSFTEGQVWRPADLKSGRIRGTLERLARPCEF